jgi:excisionase family DNA binding protein
MSVFWGSLRLSLCVLSGAALCFENYVRGKILHMRHALANEAKGSTERGRMSPLLSVPEAAELLNIKVWTLRQWLSQRRIAFIKVGRLTKLRQEDIMAFIEDNRKEAVSHDRELIA